jgi:hypothetical protein
MDLYGAKKYMFLFLLSSDEREKCGILAVPGAVTV